MAWRRVLVLVALLTAFTGAACGGGADGGHDHHVEEAADTGPPAFAEDAATTKVEVTMQDYAFVGLPASVAGPNVFFSTTIKGSNTHELEVIDSAGEAVDEVPAFKGSETRTLAVVLAPGTYTAQCLVEEGAKTHADLGMKTTFTVT